MYYLLRYLHLLLKRVPIFGVLRHPLEVITSLCARLDCL